MISKNQVKLIQSLSQKKYRKKHQLFIAEGVKIIEDLLQSDFKINTLFATENWFFKNKTISEGIKNTEIISLTEKELKHISQLNTANEVLALVEIPKEKMPLYPDISLVLESIRDPGNLGTIIRIADWYGLQEIYCSPDCVDAFNPKVVQASMGSIFRVFVNYQAPENLIADCPGHKIYGASLEGKNIHSIKPDLPGMVIIGNESRGISESTLNLADQEISIPRYGRAESLNAAVAAGIIVDRFINN